MIDMVVAKYFARLLTWRAIMIKDDNVNVTKETKIAKFAANEIATMCLLSNSSFRWNMLCQGDAS